MAVSFSHSNPPVTSISLYDTDGALKTSFDVSFCNEIAFIGDDLVAVRPTGITRLTSQSAFVPSASVLRLDLPEPILLSAPVSKNTLAIVEPVAGRLQAATMNSLVIAPMILKAPEIQGVVREKSGGGIPLVVHTIAANRTGYLYIGVTGARRQEGAPVLQFDNSGMLTNRIKCTLPTFGQDPSNHLSYMYPTMLAATNESLFWISQSEKKVAAYSLKNVN